MMPENDWYGHKLVLANYCGLDRPPPIFGSVPHGWGPDLPASRRRLAMAPLFVWNDRHLQQSTRNGVRNARCVGAPFTYLVRALWPTGDYPSGQGTLVFPSHSSEGRMETWDVHALVDRVEAECEPPFSVSVFYQEATARRTDAYREAGWRVVTFGARSEPGFLWALAREVARNGAVVGNVMQTGILYGALLGRSVRVMGPTADWIEGKGNPWNIRSTPSVWPRLHGEGLVGADARSLGQFELGWEAGVTPDALREELGWSSWPRRTGARLVAGLQDLRLGEGVRRGEVVIPLSRSKA